MEIKFKRPDKHVITGGCSFTNCAKSWPYHIDQEKYGWVHNVATPGAGQAFISRSVIYEIEEMIGNGISTEDICNELDINPSNLWVMIHRARTALMGCLNETWF